MKVQYYKFSSDKSSDEYELLGETELIVHSYDRNDMEKYKELVKKYGLEENDSSTEETTQND